MRQALVGLILLALGGCAAETGTDPLDPNDSPQLGLADSPFLALLFAIFTLLFLWSLVNA